MNQIRHVSDLRNKFPEIEDVVKNGHPVYVTKTHNDLFKRLKGVF